MSVEVWLPVAEIVKRYKDGESTYALADAYGVGQMTVWRRLCAFGVKMRPGGGRLGNKKGLQWGNKYGHRPGGPLHTSSRGYLRTRDRGGNPYSIHRACWEAYHGPMPTKHIVHHVNGDRLDNRIANLVCMTQGEHVRLHRRKKR